MGSAAKTKKELVARRKLHQKKIKFLKGEVESCDIDRTKYIKFLRELSKERKKAAAKLAYRESCLKWVNGRMKTLGFE